jgi:hypothetical protein
MMQAHHGKLSGATVRRILDAETPELSGWESKARTSFILAPLDRRCDRVKMCIELATMRGIWTVLSLVGRHDNQ